jgi:ketosteroid isomerase-like protein
LPESADIGLIRRLYELMAGGEVEPILELVDPEIELITPEGGFTAPIRGHEAARKMFASYTESFDEFRIEPQSFFAGQRLGQWVVLVRIEIRGRGSGVELTVEPAHLLEVRDGRIARLEVFPKVRRAEAFEAAGLESPD